MARKKTTRRYRRRKLNEEQLAVRRGLVNAGQGTVFVRGSADSVAHWGPSYALATPGQRAHRAAAGYTGRGDYRRYAKYAARGLGAIAGGAVALSGGANLAGLARGAFQGYNQGANFSRYMGWGDYSTNQLIDGPASEQTSISVNKTNNSGDIVLTNTEFLGNIYATVEAGGTTSSFEIRDYPLNIGLGKTFPFGSQIAHNYVLYRLCGLMFQYKPTSGEFGNVASNALGKVMMATQYDPEAPAFSNSIQMCNYDYANSTKPACGAVHGVETAPFTTPTNALYVRAGEPTKDLVFHDIGTFYLATEGIPIDNSSGLTPRSALVGELWVSYQVVLSRAQLYGTNLHKTCEFDQFKFSNGFGFSTLTPHSKNDLGGTLTSISSTKIRYTFPPTVQHGTYMISLYCVGAVQASGLALVPTAVKFQCQTMNPQQDALGVTDNRIVPGTTTNATNNTRFAQFFYVKVDTNGVDSAYIESDVSSAFVGTMVCYYLVLEVDEALLNNLN